MGRVVVFVVVTAYKFHSVFRELCGGDSPWPDKNVGLSGYVCIPDCRGTDDVDVIGIRQQFYAEPRLVSNSSERPFPILTELMILINVILHNRCKING